jgi:hypothetical protein
MAADAALGLSGGLDEASSVVALSRRAVSRRVVWRALLTLGARDAELSLDEARRVLCAVPHADRVDALELLLARLQGVEQARMVATLCECFSGPRAAYVHQLLTVSASSGSLGDAGSRDRLFRPWQLSVQGRDEVSRFASGAFARGGAGGAGGASATAPWPPSEGVGVVRGLPGKRVALLCSRVVEAHPEASGARAELFSRVLGGLLPLGRGISCDEAGLAVRALASRGALDLLPALLHYCAVQLTDPGLLGHLAATLESVIGSEGASSFVAGVTRWSDLPFSGLVGNLVSGSKARRVVFVLDASADSAVLCDTNTRERLSALRLGVRELSRVLKLQLAAFNEQLLRERAEAAQRRLEEEAAVLYQGLLVSSGGQGEVPRPAVAGAGAGAATEGYLFGSGPPVVETPFSFTIVAVNAGKPRVWSETLEEATEGAVEHACLFLRQLEPAGLRDVGQAVRLVLERVRDREWSVDAVQLIFFGEPEPAALVGGDDPAARDLQHPQRQDLTAMALVDFTIADLAGVVKEIYGAEEEEEEGEGGKIREKAQRSESGTQLVRAGASFAGASSFSAGGDAAQLALRDRHDPPQRVLLNATLAVTSRRDHADMFEAARFACKLAALSGPEHMSGASAGASPADARLLSGAAGKRGIAAGAVGSASGGLRKVAEDLDARAWVVSCTSQVRQGAVVFDTQGDDVPLYLSGCSTALLRSTALLAYLVQTVVAPLLAAGRLGGQGCLAVSAKYPRYVDLPAGSWRLWRFVFLALLSSTLWLFDSKRLGVGNPGRPRQERTLAVLAPLMLLCAILNMGCLAAFQLGALAWSLALCVVHVLLLMLALGFLGFGWLVVPWDKRFQLSGASMPWTEPFALHAPLGVYLCMALFTLTQLLFVMILSARYDTEVVAATFTILLWFGAGWLALMLPGAGAAFAVGVLVLFFSWSQNFLPASSAQLQIQQVFGVHVNSVDYAFQCLILVGSAIMLLYIVVNVYERLVRWAIMNSSWASPLLRAPDPLSAESTDDHAAAGRGFRRLVRVQAASLASCALLLAFLFSKLHVLNQTVGCASTLWRPLLLDAGVPIVLMPARWTFAAAWIALTMWKAWFVLAQLMPAESWRLSRDEMRELKAEDRDIGRRRWLRWLKAPARLHESAGRFSWPHLSWRFETLLTERLGLGFCAVCVCECAAYVMLNLNYTLVAAVFMAFQLGVAAGVVARVAGASQRNCVCCCSAPAGARKPAESDGDFASPGGEGEGGVPPTSNRSNSDSDRGVDGGSRSRTTRGSCQFLRSEGCLASALRSALLLPEPTPQAALQRRIASDHCPAFMGTPLTLADEPAGWFETLAVRVPLGFYLGWVLFQVALLINMAAVLQSKPCKTPAGFTAAYESRLGAAIAGDALLVLAATALAAWLNNAHVLWGPAWGFTGIVASNWADVCSPQTYTGYWARVTWRWGQGFFKEWGAPHASCPATPPASCTPTPQASCTHTPQASCPAPAFAFEDGRCRKLLSPATLEQWYPNSTQQQLCGAGFAEELAGCVEQPALCPLALGQAGALRQPELAVGLAALVALLVCLVALLLVRFASPGAFSQRRRSSLETRRTKRMMTFTSSSSKRAEV